MYIDTASFKATEQSRKIIDHAEECITSMKKEGENYMYLLANKAFCQALGKPEEEIIGKTVAEIWGEDTYRTSIKPYLDEALKTQMVQKNSNWFEFGNLGVTFTETNYSPINQEQLVIISRNKTEEAWTAKADAAISKMMTELLLAKEEKTMHTILKETLQNIFTDSKLSFSLYLQDSEKAENTHLMLSEGEAPANFPVEDCWALRTKKPHICCHDKEDPLCSHITETEEAFSICLPLNGSTEIHGLLSITCGDSNLHLNQQDLIEMKVKVAEQITQRFALCLANFRLRKTLHKEAVKDPLTGLYNRRHMEAVLAREALRAKRHETPISLILFDIDHFKIFNDTYGHKAGDLVLKELSSLIRRSIRAEDIACRYGGEEVLLILPETDITIATERAQTICKKIAEDFRPKYENQEFTVTISMGVAAFPNHGKDIESVVKAADLAMYYIKQNGRNGVHVAE